MAGLLPTDGCEPCSKSELMYDALPPTQVAILDDYKVYCGPKAAVTDESPLTFEVTGSGDDYTDLGDAVLKLRVKLTLDNGDRVEHLKRDNSPGQHPTVAPINGFLHSMFSQVDVSLNDTLISQSTNTYPYRAYMSTLLSYGAGAKKSWLSMELWENDLAGKFESTDNTGHSKRKNFVKNGREVDLKGRLHMDLAFQNRLLPNGVTARITLTRAKPSFTLMAFEADPAAYKIEITHASLEVRKVKLVPTYQLELEKTLAKSGARLPITHVVTKNFSIPMGISTFDLDGLFMGQLPNRIVLGLVENESFNGVYGKNPFNFKHFDLSFLCLNVEGKQVPGKPLQPDYEQGFYIDCYETLFTGTSMYGDDLGHGIDRSMYPNGFCLYCFNLTVDQSDGVSHVNPRRHGTVRASLNFAKTLPCTVTLIALGQFDNVITIDQHRNIIYDYAT